ncbi:hypothetical protein ACNKHM_21225 [Shigella sonnei]
MAGLKEAGLKVGTPFFVRYGRVKIEDQIVRSEARSSDPAGGRTSGLGQSESLSCYAVTRRVWRPPFRPIAPVSGTFTRRHAAG